MSRCTNCSYCWADPGEKYVRCHYESMGEWDPAPCEYDDQKEPVGVDEEGYEIWE